MKWLKRLTAGMLAAALAAVLPVQALAVSPRYADKLWGGQEQAGWADPWEQARNEAKLRHGGTPRAVDIMLNGQCLDFGDMQPVNLNGSVMAASRVLLENLGAEEIVFDAETKTMTAAGHGVTLSQQANTAVLTVTRGGETETVTMAAPSFIRDGALYLPIRETAEAMGYEVYWDPAYQTVVLMDSLALIDQIDTQFTKINRFLSSLTAVPSAGQSVAQTVEYTVVHTDMQEERTETCTTRTVTGSAGWESWSQGDGETAATLYDAASQQYYMLIPEMGENTWLQTGYGELYGVKTVEIPASMGAYLYGLTNAYSPFELHEALMAEVEMMAILCGDDAFVVEDGQDVLYVDQDDLSQLDQLLYGESGEMNDAGLAFQLRLALADTGWELTVSSDDAQTAMDLAVTLTQRETGSDTVMSMVITQTEETAAISYTAQTDLVDGQPQTVPPEDATVLTEAELLTMDAGARDVSDAA